MSGMNFKEEKPKLGSFLKKRKIKLMLGKSRVKTEASSYCEADFQFLKHEDKKH